MNFTKSIFNQSQKTNRPQTREICFNGALWQKKAALFEETKKKIFSKTTSFAWFHNKEEGRIILPSPTLSLNILGS
jgi:hypothetical protein